MKTIGMIGGTSWVSTADYYRIINQQVNKHLGGINSAQILLYSVNYVEFKAYVDGGLWTEFAARVTEIGLKLQAAGADCLLLCANTMHSIADEAQKGLNIPIIHIADVTAAEINKQQLKKVALLGTRFTMERDFFKDRLTKAGIETLIPEAGDRAFLHETIFGELGNGIFTADTKGRYLKIMESLLQQGAQGIIFGCTEIPLLIPPAECNFPVFDTLEIHAAKAVEFALGIEI